MFNQFMPYQFNQQQAQFNQIPQNDNDRIFVSNATSAEAYLVASGGFVRLWDSTRNVFYEKSADMSGRQFPMRVFEYKEITESGNDFESRLKAIENKLSMLEGVNDEPTNK